MRIITVIAFTSFVLVSSAFAQHHHTEEARSQDQVMHTHHPSGESNGRPAVISGYVRDIACLLRNPQAGAAVTPLTRDCMNKCVRNGSPIAILTEEGTLYTPISDVIPDKSARATLLPFVGKYVSIEGQVFERGTLHSISISKIKVIDRPPDSKIPTL